jgi:hypothetical protein
MIEFSICPTLRPVNKEEIEIVQTKLVQSLTDIGILFSMPINKISLTHFAVIHCLIS